MGRTIIGPEDGTLISLATLERGRAALIRPVGRAIDGARNPEIERRLLEIGFEEGREAEVRHIGPIGGDPVAVHGDTDPHRPCAGAR